MRAQVEMWLVYKYKRPVPKTVVYIQENEPLLRDEAVNHAGPVVQQSSRPVIERYTPQ